MANIFKRVFNSKPVQAYIRFMQRILVTFFLTLLYFIMIPITWLLIVVFKKKMLYPVRNTENSFWMEAKDYSMDYETSLHQS